MRNLLWCLLIIGFVLVSGVSAQPELDTTFGDAGTAYIDTIRSLAATRDMAIQADNKIVLVSPCTNIDLAGVPFCAVRLNDDGSTDSTFQNQGNGPGVFTWFNPGHTGGVGGVAIQADGKIVAAGFGPGLTAALVRYNTDGSLDSSFGSGGVVLSDITPGSDDLAEKVTIQPDGKIVIVGSTGNAQFVARYLPGGTLDSSFGTGGIAKTTILQNSVEGRSIALQPDGKILAGGIVLSGSYLLTRFNSNGSPDAAWDGDGVKIVPLDPPGPVNAFWLGLGIRSIAVQPDGRVVALGHKNIIFRFNADGSPDTSFDSDGSRPALNGTDKETYSLILSPGGTITAVGARLVLAQNVPYSYLVARYTPDGSPDTTFSDDGYLDIDVPGFNSAAKAIAADPIGRIVVAGVSGSGIPRAPFGTPVFSAARLLGAPFPVAISGRVTDSNGSPIRNATVKTDVGGTIITARTNPFGYYSLAGVLTNQTYTLSVSAKGHRISDQSVYVNNQFVTVDFVAQ